MKWKKRKNRNTNNRNTNNRNNTNDTNKRNTSCLQACLVLMTGAFILQGSTVFATGFGGFDVEVTTGEEWEYPADWEKEPSNLPQEEVPESIPKYKEEIPEQIPEQISEQLPAEIPAEIPEQPTAQNWKQETNSWQNETDSAATENGNPLGENLPEGNPADGYIQPCEPVCTITVTPTITTVPPVTPTTFPDEKEKKEKREQEKEQEEKKQPILKNQDAAVVIHHEKQRKAGEPVRIQINSKGSVQILSFRINKKECAWKWKEDGIEAMILEKENPGEETMVELLVISQSGKIYQMEPWIFSA